jgi:putative ABC transport system permease protein
LLSKDFAVLAVVSCVLSAPIAYYLLNNWLQRFEYRTGISLWTFAFVGAGSVIITLLTVSYQAIKVALMNPVESLRSE